MYEALLVLHFLGLAAGIGTSLFMAGLGMRASMLPPESGGSVMATATSVAGVLSGASLLLLWGSGIALVAIYDSLAQSGGVLFYIKLALVLLLTGGVGLIHLQSARMKTAADESGARSVERLAKALLILGVAVVVLAVLAFG